MSKDLSIEMNRRDLSIEMNRDVSMDLSTEECGVCFTEKANCHLCVYCNYKVCHECMCEFVEKNAECSERCPQCRNVRWFDFEENGIRNEIRNGIRNGIRNESISVIDKKVVVYTFLINVLNLCLLFIPFFLLEVLYFNRSSPPRILMIFCINLIGVSSMHFILTLYAIKMNIRISAYKSFICRSISKAIILNIFFDLVIYEPATPFIVAPFIYLGIPLCFSIRGLE